jgi:hypothetical protein
MPPGIPIVRNPYPWEKQKEGEMSTALQTVPEGTLAERLDDIDSRIGQLERYLDQTHKLLHAMEEKQDESLRLQSEIATFANSVADLVNGFDPSGIPAPFRAMLGLSPGK